MDNGKVLFLLGLASWLLIKWFGLGTWTWETSNQAGIFSNLGWITIIAAYHAMQSRISGRVFLERWKLTARKTMTFSAVLVATMGLWHFVFVPEPMEQRKKEQLQLLEEMIQDESALQAFRNQQPTLSNLDNQAIFDRQADSIETLFSPLFYTGMVAMAWIFTSLIVSGIFAFILPKIWGVTSQ
jgi:hypothetical protein